MKKSKWLKYKQQSKRDKLIKCVIKTAENSIKQAAIIRKDEVILRKISGEDLVAKEAHYHEECRKKYINTKHISLRCSEKNNQENNQLELAHREAFSVLVEYIEKEIINNATIVRITHLKQHYQLFIKENYPTIYNPNYRTQKLKEKIVHHHKGRVHFSTKA